MFHFAVVPLLSADGVGLGDGRHIQGERAVPKRKRVAQADNITWPRRDVGRGPLGGAVTSASPDNDRMPKSTPGSTGLCDETAIDLSEFGLNPFNLSNKFELHVLKREFVALPSGANLESNAFIFEYDGTKGQYYGSQELTYPHGDKQRNFYQIGDVIMIAAYSVALVERRLPQVAALFRTNDWFLMAASALGLKITLGCPRCIRIRTAVSSWAYQSRQMPASIGCTVDGSGAFSSRSKRSSRPGSFWSAAAAETASAARSAKAVARRVMRPPSMMQGQEKPKAQNALAA